MARNFSKLTVSKFAIPGVALAVLAGAALAAQQDTAIENAAGAYEQSLRQLPAEDAAAHAVDLFDRADMDDSGALDDMEYQALAVVTAELGRLNGFVPVLVDGEVKTAAFAAGPLPALSGPERARVEAIAVRDFHLSAGADGVIDEDEFVQETLERFQSADRNRNGALGAKEIAIFAASTARLPQSSV